MNVTPSQLNAVLRTLREVGYTGLDEAEQQIVQAFNDGDLNVVENSGPREPEYFGGPGGLEFVPRDHNDADGVQTMRDQG